MEILTKGSAQMMMGSMARAPIAPQKKAPEAALQTLRSSADVQQPRPLHQTFPNFEDVSEAVRRIGEVLTDIQSDLHFEVDSDSDRLVVKMINRQTQEVIRQIPSETALEMAKTMNNLAGRLVSAKA